MTEVTPLRTVLLDNGLRLDFYDRTNRYFGDFHRVLLLVEGRIDAQSAEAGSPAVLLDTVLFQRELERMGVTSAALDVVTSELTESFLESAGKYLARPEMPEQLQRKYREEKIRRRRSSLHGLLGKR